MPSSKRSAILLGRDQAIFGMQVERVVREAASPARRTFPRRPPHAKCLAEVLDDDEVHRNERVLPRSSRRPPALEPH
jgi:hypothetical protein